jgi:flagellar hook-associated protein 1 FlgK
MGLLNSALQIGRSAILSYQGALQTVGSNVSSAGSPDYTRLASELDPVPGTVIANGLQPGAGVALADIRRYVDDALEGRLRLAIGATQAASARQATLGQVESFMDDTTGAGIATRLGSFFQVFDNLQNTPEDTASRDLAISAGSQLADSLTGLRTQFARLGADVDSQIGDAVKQADDIASQIADLNARITTGEAGRRGQATALRDQRDALLRKLGELFDVTVREQPDGGINVYVGNEALVQGGASRGLVAVIETDGEFVRTSVRFADTNQQVEIRGGRLAGLIKSRDEDAYGRVAGLDELAAAIIADVNRIHADGQGINGFRSVTGSYDVLSPDALLNDAAAGLPNPPKSGSFYVTVADDASKTPVAYRIEVNFDGQGGGTTLRTLVDDFNAQVQGVTASITGDNRIAFKADDGFSFTFGYDGQQSRADTSGVLAALGINTFFSGTDAKNIAVNETLQQEPSLLAAGSIFLPSDGANARRVASLDTAASDLLTGVSIPEFFNGLANSVAVTAAGANSDVDAASAVQSALQAQRESISGVNLDEEAIALVKFQRAFQGAARFVSVVDQMIGDLVNLIR